MGGVIIDRDCQTAIPGLLVAGEDSGGVHGANRLGGNGVAESTIFGGRAGDQAALTARERRLRDPDPAQVSKSAARAMAPLQREGPANPFQATQELKETMWEGCGVARDRKGLLRTRDKIEDLTERAADTTVPGPREANYAWQEALDLSNQLEVARIMVESALVREESRGSHYRSDHPDQDDARWLRFIIVRRGPDDEVEVERRPVKFSRKRPDPAEPSAEDLERGEPQEEPGRKL
jgi:succinate dehydrogenase / fumarate reductase flavoprotein subunit/fumarate reductase flavoprotein subunit